MRKNIIELIVVSLISILTTLTLVDLYKPKVIDGGTPWSNGFDNHFGCRAEDITQMYTDYIKQWKKDVSIAFNEAEVKIYNITPTPDIVGPDEDPAKCICKGTGVIQQGDGHTTPCPYHGSKFNKPLLILEK